MDTTPDLAAQPWTPTIPEAYLREDLRIRELPPNEWYRLGEAGGFFEDPSRIPAPTSNTKVLVAEALEWDSPDQLQQVWRVVIYCPLFDAVHAEPLQVREDYRRHPHLGQAFLGGLVLLLQTLDIRHVWATIADGQPGAESIIEKLGFTPLPGRVWTGRIPEKEDEG